MPQANLTPVIGPYDPATIPSPTPQQQERLARAREALFSGYASDGVRSSKPALAAAALAVGIAAPELLAPLGAALGETAEGAAAAGAVRGAAGFIGQAARAFCDSSGAAARSLVGTLADPARLGEAAAQFTRSAFVDKARDAVVIGAAGEALRRTGGAVQWMLAHRHHHHHAPSAQLPSVNGDR
jgi:hypothetical protein